MTILSTNYLNNVSQLTTFVIQKRAQSGNYSIICFIKNVRLCFELTFVEFVSHCRKKYLNL